ncbi:hypothetical protein B0T17DRAFT_629454 [Bombardia bombarda]|uniref:Tat pathway signal sequence protein n=1 Tax=Bombardia bombarda TaxID=252184 RepID=A0AA39U1N8_9PEZI|nr:hypothetical protein B0T17DRAFT_629454 [Bombardia bombarda]
MAQDQYETEPFLGINKDTPVLKAGSRSKRRVSFSCLLAINGILCFLQLILFIFNVGFFLTGKPLVPSRSNLNGKEQDFEKAFSPARSAIEYSVEVLGYENSPFTGEPRPELDEAWSDLLRSTMVKISNEEMERMNKTSITMKDGSGYLGYLEAHHMLHCVKRLYQYQNQDHYPELKADGSSFSSHHRNHCLEVLRQGIMCNADVSVNTFFWENPRKIKGDRSGPRKCTNWDRLQAWADERTVQYDDINQFLATLVYDDDL